MEQKLKNIQELTKRIARLALTIEHNVDVELKCGQWNSWTEEDVKTNLEIISDDAKVIKQLLTELKKDVENA